MSRSSSSSEEEELAASSPDELAFVAGAEHFGFEYVSRNVFDGLVTLRDKQSGAEHDVKLLEVFAYESSRKRMSVLVSLPEALLASIGALNELLAADDGGGGGHRASPRLDAHALLRQLRRLILGKGRRIPHTATVTGSLATKHTTRIADLRWQVVRTRADEQVSSVDYDPKFE